MRILFVHNHYLRPGGEDAVFAAEKALLEHEGHEVVSYVAHNQQVRRVGYLRAAVETVWSETVRRELARVIRAERPEVVHFHNTFFRISPAAYYAVKAEKIPVIQTLHNYRLICPGALLMRQGHLCEACVGQSLPWPGIAYGCWRGSRTQTAVVAAMLVTHRALGTWAKQVDLYIALTEFARRKFVEGGLPAEKIVVKPNFVYPDPGVGEHTGDFALFVGRLSEEKGVRTMLQAWQRLKGRPLKLVGDGPFLEEARMMVGEEVRLLGYLPREEMFFLMQRARFLLFPSEVYETFGLSMIEAFATGLPVIASNLGAMAEIVEHGRTGLLFEPGNPDDLAAKVEWAWAHPRQMAEMGREARREYEQKYTAERNYQRLMEIYQLAMEKAQ